MQIIFKATNFKEIFSFYRSLIDIDVNYKIAQLKENCKRKQTLIIKGICIQKKCIKILVLGIDFKLVVMPDLT